MLVGRQQAAAEEDAAGRGDPDAGVTVGAAEALRREELRDARGEPAIDGVRELEAQAVGRPPEAGEVLRQLRRAAAADPA
jgi:hypothetical protein